MSETADTFVNFSTHMLGTQPKSEPTRPYLISLGLFREAAELCDAASILIKRGSGDAIFVLSRSCLEIWAQMRWLHLENTELRSLCYLYSRALRYKQVTNETAENGVKSGILSEPISKDDDFFSYGDQLSNSIDSSSFNPVRSLFEGRKLPKARDPWYSYEPGGPSNLGSLTEKLGKLDGHVSNYQYSLIYRFCSMIAHGSDVIRHFDTSDGDLKIFGIRNPQRAVMSLNYICTTFASGIMPEFINQWLPESSMNTWRYWHLAHAKPRLEKN